MKKVIIITVVFVLLFTTFVNAHPGRLDSKGGHRDRKNGGYHYHRDPGYVTPSTRSYNSISADTQGYISGENDYICPYSNKRELTQADISNKSDWILILMRNEIYARHGGPFQDAEIRAHFVSRKWYRVNNNYNDNTLSRIEVYNIDFIMKHQN